MQQTCENRLLSSPDVFNCTRAPGLLPEGLGFSYAPALSHPANGPGPLCPLNFPILNLGLLLDLSGLVTRGRQTSLCPCRPFAWGLGPLRGPLGRRPEGPRLWTRSCRLRTFPLLGFGSPHVSLRHSCPTAASRSKIIATRRWNGQTGTHSRWATSATLIFFSVSIEAQVKIAHD